MPDRNDLLGLLAVRNGWVQPAEVVAAHVALAVTKRSMTAELIESGALPAARQPELEQLADAALKKAGGDVGKAIAENGGSASAPPVGPSPDDVKTGSNPAVPFGDEDEERTSIKLDMDAPLPASAEKPRGFDEEDEPTKVLDWDRAMKKSLK